MFMEGAFMKKYIFVFFLFLCFFFFLRSKKEETILLKGNQTEEGFFEHLEQLEKKDKRIQKVLNHREEYPIELLEMLSNNIEMLDFVLDYPEKEGNVYADTVEEAKKGTIPFLLQWDSRWGYADYGGQALAISGCGPTALSMVLIGLTGDSQLTPYKIAKFSEKEGFFYPNTGTSWSLMSEGAEAFGVKSTELSLSKEAIYQSLRNGNPIICSMRPGDFTKTGHFIVLAGLEGNKIRVYDPNSISRSETLWDYERLSYQIKNLWSFSYNS